MARLTRRDALRGAVLLGGAAALLTVADPSAGAALAAPDQPSIDSCGAWGARPPAGPLTIVQHRPNKIIVHHTALANSTDTSRAHAFAASREIQDLHMDGNGWIDSGQHFTNSRGGWLTEGRHGSLYALLHSQTMVQGAHCVGQNDQAIGIENEGTYLTEQPPAALWSSLIAFCAFTCHQYGIPATEIYGHKDFNNTQCPGLLHARLPELRSAVAARL
ncbi:peptidoglycan recognition family protein [Dactylosporangium maewongense]|uniref:Peptidoglycan recognition family protein n=1 Tax=Dactylosporangium maewongense TaxID=634393 RepID=A0ABP4LU71_9ACTN